MESNTVASVTVLIGDVRRQLATLPPASVHCVVTSPPYWQLRSYLPPNDPAKEQEIGNEATPAEYIAHLVSVFDAVARVLRPDGTPGLISGIPIPEGIRRGCPVMPNGACGAGFMAP
ncbi:DNA methyltransferase [Sulfobacillus thermosulfidooxidans]|uniref:DNA methyltransferase n=1 Tax=Sulfobacillus thermosulfidooxidans TaxID=28034 RepID=UPI0006B48174|nr:DNA methyltransferase [Sulfobacillus thermosulfidooxidans]